MQNEVYKNNILGKSDEPVLKQNKSTSESYFTQIRFSQIKSIILIYGACALQFINMLISMVIRNVYEFIFRKEKSVRGENVLITGSGSYLGRFLAIEFAKRGATLFLLDNNEKRKVCFTIFP